MSYTTLWKIGFPKIHQNHKVKPPLNEENLTGWFLKFWTLGFALQTLGGAIHFTIVVFWCFQGITFFTVLCNRHGRPPAFYSHIFTNMSSSRSTSTPGTGTSLQFFLFCLLFHVLSHHLRSPSRLWHRSFWPWPLGHPLRHLTRARK